MCSMMDASDARGSETQRKTDAIAAGRPWGVVCCVGCLLLVLAVVVGTYVVLRIMAGSPTTSLSSLPANYPTDLPLYRIRDADAIVMVEGKNRGAMFRILSAPAVLVSKVAGSSASSTSAFRNAKGIMAAYSSNLESNDSVTVTWKGLPGTKEEIVGYYSGLFRSADMKEEIVRDDAAFSTLMLGKRASAAMQVYIQDLPSTPEVDDVTVVVDYLR